MTHFGWQSFQAAHNSFENLKYLHGKKEQKTDLFLGVLEAIVRRHHHHFLVWPFDCGSAAFYVDVDKYMINCQFVAKLSGNILK